MEISHLLKLANEGDANSQYILGKKYQAGDEVNLNFNTAIKLYRNAANQGHIDAQYALGILLLHLDKEGKNSDEAEEWLQKAANNGNENAQSKLYMIHSEVAEENPETVDIIDPWVNEEAALAQEEQRKISKALSGISIDASGALHGRNTRNENSRSYDLDNVLSTLLISSFFLAGTGIFFGQVYYYLKDGVWYSLSVINGLQNMPGTEKFNWLSNPDNWIGLWNVLDFIPLSITFLTIWLLMLSDRK